MQLSGSKLMLLASRIAGCAVTLVALMWWLATHACAQPVSFKRISVEHGLPSAYVTTIFQDSKGFMWFGTDAGLCRYDGHTVRVFKNNPADSTSLSANTAWSLCEDRQARLWVGTYGGGLNCLDLKTERVTMTKDFPLPESANEVPIKALLVDRANVLWIGTFGAGLVALNLTTREVRHFTHDSLDPGSLPSNTIFCLLEDHSGRVWIGTAGGLCSFDRGRESFTRYVHDPGNPRTLSNNIVVTVYEDLRHRLWVGTKNGLNVLLPGSNAFKRYRASPSRGLLHPSVYAIGEHCAPHDTSVWIGTDGGGMHRYNEFSDSFTAYTNQPDDPTSLSDNHINGVFTDRSGTLWIATLQGGASRIDKQHKNVRHWRHSTSAPNSLSRGPVYSLVQDSSGNFWIGTYTGGLCRYEARSGSFLRYAPGAATGLTSSDISALLTDRTGQLWVGTPGRGLLKYVARAERFVPFSSVQSNQRRMQGAGIDELFQDSEGDIWIGTSGQGLLMYRPATDVLVGFFPQETNPRSISHSRITVIRECRGMLWIGTEGGGLNVLDRTTREFAHYRFEASDTNSLSNDLVYAIHEDRSGAIWVGTSNGLNRFDPTTGTFRRYFTRDGLASDYIKGILEDRTGNIWLITASAISRMSPDGRSIVNFDYHDGFVNLGFNDAYLIAREGQLYVGGSEGVDIFHPDSLVVDETPPPVVLTEFTVYNNPYTLPQAVPFTSEIASLEWNQNFFSISFSVLDYANPERNLYSYRMAKEDDPTWTSSGANRFANFTNLDHGTYLFTATGANSNGVWNRQGTSLRITIRPPFWKTWWFITLMVLAVVGMLAIVYNVRVSHLLKIERLRVRIASDLHDDVGSSLSAIALMTEVVSRRLPEGSVERERLMAATHVTRTTADALRDIVWLINPEHENVQDLIQRMKDAASKLLLNTHLIFEVDHNGFPATLDMEFRRHLILLYKEILNNIARHAAATEVRITLRRDDGALFLRVSDNGKGFDETTIRRGSGLTNLRLRAERIGGTISITSAPGKGTTVELRAKIP